MPSAIALRSFDHNGKVAKGETVTFDANTIAALRRSGLVSKEDAPAPKQQDDTPPPPPQATALPTKSTKPTKPKTHMDKVTGARGKKSAALPAVPASPPPTVTPSEPGNLPPPPPVA